MKGHQAVVFFYPKDASPGCTREVCGFRGAWKEFQQAGIGVIGVSGDSRESHQRWLADEHLPFALASDESGTIARSYGVGHKLWGDDRVTFLIDANGRVARVWPSVDPGIHYKEVLAAAGHAE
jgi:peroxiredoxin Q/BCP